MPIYEYECNNCGHVFEVWQSIHEEPVKECELCSGEVVKKISQSSFVLKGSGWYATDYASKNSACKTGKAASSDSSRDNGEGRACESSSKCDKTECGKKQSSS